MALSYRLMTVFVLFLFILPILFPTFTVKKMSLTISDIQEDGSAKVVQDIFFIMDTEKDKETYLLTMNKNDLASWREATGLKEIKYYIDPVAVDIKSIKVSPYPLETYVSAYGGGLKIEYMVSPIYAANSSKPKEGTGIFTVNNYKPRTKRFSINPNALAFKRTDKGDIILDKKTTVKIVFPEKSIVYVISPIPEGKKISLPNTLSSISWHNQILAKFSVVFDIEQNIGYEISNSINSILGVFEMLFEGENALFFVIIVITISIASIMLYKRTSEIKRKR